MESIAWVGLGWIVQPPAIRVARDGVVTCTHTW